MPGSTQTRCQMLAVFRGWLGSTRIDRPRIWFERTYEPTKLARISVSMQGASHPPPKSDFVPTRAVIPPRSNTRVINWTLPWWYSPCSSTVEYFTSWASDVTDNPLGERPALQLLREGSPRQRGE